MLKLFSRLVVGALLLSLAAVLLVAGAVTFLIGSETGNRFLRDRTHATIARLLGPGYVSDLGEQTFEIRADGTLAVGWNGVRLTRVDDPSDSTAIDRAAFAIRLLPLVGGGLEFGRLEIEGARIDVSPFVAERDAREGFAGLSAVTGGAVDALERQLAALDAFRFETIAFNDITVEGLPAAPGGIERLHVGSAELRRTGSGALNLAAAIELGPMPLSLTGEASFRDAGRLEALSLRSSPADLRRLMPPSAPGPDAAEPPFATDSDLSVTLAIARSHADERLVTDLSLTSGPGALQMGRNRTRIEEMRLRLRHREGEERIEIVESPMQFTGVAFALSGVVEPMADGSRALRFSLAAPAIRSVVGQGGEADSWVPVAGSLEAEGAFDPAAGLSELTRLDFRSGEGRLTGTGRLDVSAPDARSHLDLRGENVSAAAAKAFWPFNLAGRARHWVIDHVGDEGTIRDATIALDVSQDRFASAFGHDGRIRAEEMRIALAVEDTVVDPPGELPRVYQANGRVLVAGGRTEVELDDAMVAEHAAVALGRSTLSLSRAPEEDRRDTILELSVEAAGSLPELLAVANARPIAAMRTLDLGPADATGTGQVTATARLRLGEDVAPQDLVEDWSASGTVMDASVLVPVEGRRFANLSGTFAIGPNAADAELSGFMDDIPAQIDLALPIGPAPSVQRLVAIELDVSAAKAGEIVPALRGSIEGPIAARITQDDAGLRARLDLTRTSLSIPTLAWRKGQGVGATVDVAIAQDGQETALRDLRIEGAGFSASGSAVIDAEGLRSARLGDVALNPGDSVALSMDRTGNGFTMTVDGRQFDARPLLQELRASAGRPREGGSSGLTFDVAANIETVRGFDDRILSGIALNYASHNGRLAALSVGGRTGEGALRVDLSPREGGQSIQISTEDLGAFVGFAGLYGNMERGAAVLEVLGRADGSYEGRIDLRDFTLVDEPRLERIVGSEPVAGQGTLSQAFGQDLRTTRAYFDQASAALRYADGRLSVTSGIVRGPVFGSSFAGTLYDRDSRIDIAGSFMPAYNVNRLFGAIPLVGRILGNGNEGGLLGITYQLSGAFASPTLTVNPISLIAPGVFRQIFEY